MDWPLSKEEQKRHVLRLYDKDVKAADRLLASGDAALKALRSELHLARAAGSESVAKQDCEKPVEASEQRQGQSTESGQIHVDPALEQALKLLVASQRFGGEAPGAAPGAAQAAERLQLAIVDAAAALAALLGTTSLSSAWGKGLNESQEEPGGSPSEWGSPEARQRARSEGAGRLAPPALVKGDRRRRSRAGEVRRVSFADQDRKAAQDDKEDEVSNILPDMKLKSATEEILAQQEAGDEPEPDPSHSPREKALKEAEIQVLLRREPKVEELREASVDSRSAPRPQGCGATRTVHGSKENLDLKPLGPRPNHRPMARGITASYEMRRPLTSRREKAAEISATAPVGVMDFL